MLFNSLEFAMFFPTVVLLYSLATLRWQWVVLLVASCVFYIAFIPAYLVVLAFIILVDYTAALLIERSAGRNRRGYLTASIVANIGTLAVFKYYVFLTGTVSWLWGLFGYALPAPILSLALPIGLSFHTFQALSYTIEVYKGNQRAERHLGRYALYVLFFPQLVAGPIERPQRLLPQLGRYHTIQPDDVTNGLKLMAWGLFKKLAIADRLAIVVDEVYGHPLDYQGAQLALATVFFAFQVYCDFSGYSDIAIGAAQVMGIRLSVNFRRPFLSTSLSEFWTKWHVSLSSWFRDYVYIPLGGSRAPLWRSTSNLIATFLLSGLWHGASWRFVLWGGLNGLLVAIGKLTKPSRYRLRDAMGLEPTPVWFRAVQTSATVALFSATLVVFRASTLQEAVSIFTRLGRTGESILFTVTGENYLLVPYGICAMCGLLLIEGSRNSDDPREWLRSTPAWVRWSVYYGLIGATVMLGVATRSAFFYFQF